MERREIGFDGPSFCQKGYRVICFSTTRFVLSFSNRLNLSIILFSVLYCLHIRISATHVLQFLIDKLFAMLHHWDRSANQISQGWNLKPQRIWNFKTFLFWAPFHFSWYSFFRVCRKMSIEKSLTASPISKLNDDCLELIFKACDGCPFTLCTLTQVCRQWYIISQRSSVVKSSRISLNLNKYHSN